MRISSEVSTHVDPPMFHTCGPPRFHTCRTPKVPHMWNPQGSTHVDPPRIHTVTGVLYVSPSQSSSLRYPSSRSELEAVQPNTKEMLEIDNLGVVQGVILTLR